MACGVPHSEGRCGAAATHLRDQQLSLHRSEHKLQTKNSPPHTHTHRERDTKGAPGFADAKIALDFHAGREKNPSLFSHRAINKLWYAGYGIKAAVWDKKEVQSIDQVVAL